MRAHWIRLILIVFAFALVASWSAGEDKPAVIDKAHPPEGTPQPPPATPTPESAKHKPRGWNDKRRTVRGYFQNLAYDTPRVFSRPNLVPLLVGAGASGAATALDSETVSYFTDHPNRTLGNWGAQAGGTFAAAGLAIGLFSAGRIAPGDKFRSFTYDASQAMLITTAYTFALKLSTRRMRPDDSNRQSFPSGHASLAFSWASVLGRYYGPAGAIPGYTVASLIAVSRLAHRSHYLSDIVAGATLGFTTGQTVVRGNSRRAGGEPASPVVPKPSVELMPDLGPDGRGSGLAVVVNF
jgi:membrane-associated phospholipid phosphatase